jgi:glutamate carboxypeptidase
MPELKTFFEPKQQAMVDLLQELIAIESPSNVKTATDTMASKMEALFIESGASVERHSREVVGDILLAKWNQEGAGKPILIVSHMDTVWPIGSTTSRPTRIDADGRLYGMGAVDMKGGIVVALTAIQGLIERSEMPNRPIWFMATSDEEIGSKHSRELIEKAAKESALVLVVEPPTGDGSLKTWRKGVASYRLTIEGKAAHAGNEPEAGVNAIIEFAQQALEINKMNDFKNGTSVSVTMVEGGTAANVIPALVTARVDVRMMTQAVFAKLHEKLMSRPAFIPGAKATMEHLNYRPPMERDGKAFETARDIAKAEGITIREDGAGGGSDGNFTAALGIPTLDGLGAEGAGLHAEHEHVLVNSLPKKASLIAAILRDWE